MKGFFRSEDMALCQLYIHPEAAYFTVSKFGEIGNVQFRDLNDDATNFKRQFVREVRRCEEMERRLRYIREELKKDDLVVDERLNEIPRAPTYREINDLQGQIEKTEHDIRELSQNGMSLKNDYIEYTELRHILEMMQIFFSEEEESSYSIIRAIISNENTRERLEFITGVVNRERMPAFERMLWRVSRGNVFIRQANLSTPLEDPATGNEVYKIAFVIFFQGEQLRTRIKKICDGFRACVYACPTKYSERIDMVKDVCIRLEDLKLVLNQTQDYRHRVLSNVAKILPKWIVMVRKIKAIFHTMNHFDVDVSKKCFIAECWVPESELPTIQDCLNEGSRLSNSSVRSFSNVIPFDEEPPTFNRLNKFTRAFQVIIDAYGVSSYHEVNPALYTTITFPFLFAVMFGDMGHGLMMLLMGLYMVLWERKLQALGWRDEMWTIFFGGRYIILLMGLFSIYTGLIYNEVFAKSFNIFGSSWSFSKEFAQEYPYEELQKIKLLGLDPNGTYTPGSPYLAGIDPVWPLATNKIIFLNSFKMKMSIIIGVIHMILGIFLSAVNFAYFKKYANILLEVLPEVVFLLSLFGYFIFLVFLKQINYGATEDGIYSEACAPSVLISFINMMMLSENVELPNCEAYMFPYQRYVQIGLIVLAAICVPVLLLGKPLLHRRHLRTAAMKSRGKNAETDLNGNASEMQSMMKRRKKKEEEEEFSEVLIHQAIHTIEFVLSTVSHVASYLRLWALALAHAQLTELLWSLFSFMFKTTGEMGEKIEFEYLGAIGFFLGFVLWASLTVGLVIIEGLSAFLHTLRLHWVEFMSKFYGGTGYAFEPFSFKIILDDVQDDES